MTRPLVVNTIPGNLFVRPFGRLPVDVSDLGGAARYTPKVAYMRAGHETELRRDILVKAVEVESDLRKRGARIVNPVWFVARAQRKDLYPALIPSQTPVLLTNPTPWETRAAVAAGVLRFPFVLRRADWSGSREMYLIHDRDELAEAESKLLNHRTIAARYVDTQQGGLHTRWRFYVIGGTVDMFSRTRSTKWNVGNEGGKDAPTSYREELGRAAIAVGPALGLEIYCVDIVLDGEAPMVVDVNPTYFMTDGPLDVPVAVNAHRLRHWERIVRYLEGLQ